MFAIFLVVQGADGLMTYEAVRAFGPSAESNQLLVMWMSIAGFGAAIAGAKALACACGAILYSLRVHSVLATLTAVYLVFAIVPWLHTLAAL